MSHPADLLTPRLRLRPMSAADAEDLHRQWNDPAVGRFLWDGQPVPRERVDEVIARSAADFTARGFGLWTATLAPGGRVAGFSGLRVEADTGRVELLYAFDHELWGRGLATEAGRAVLADAFTRLGLPVVYAGTNPANPASWRVLERLGMSRVARRPTPVEDLLIYARAAPYDHGATMDAPSWLTRLATQLDGLPLLLGEATPEALQRPSPSGKWSVHDNLAHLARQHEVFLDRVRRILAEEAPALPQYRAEDDAAWPALRSLPTDEVLRRLRSRRAELIDVARSLSPAHLARTGTHSRFGSLTLSVWIEFFLVHEAHHLYTILKRTHGAD
jgi:RimJ/RimL family protein N-acetyltransferase